MPLKRSLRLIDTIALNTLAAGVALVQRSPEGSLQSGSDGDGVHSTQYNYFIHESKTTDPMILAAAIYRLTCRTNFAAPGYALIRQTDIASSKEQRKSIVTLKENLSAISQAMAGRKLGWFALNRFDQKNSSKPHRDGAPAQSLLLLGYEPTKVKSDLFITDYSACAYELGLSPVQFLEEFNPMYKKGLDRLAPYAMPLVEFDPASYNLLIINNSSQTIDKAAGHWQGVLHFAHISGGQGPRVINSTSLMALQEGEEPSAPAKAEEWFLNSDKLSDAAYPNSGGVTT